MTPEEVNKAIAEACGWKRTPHFDFMLQHPMHLAGTMVETFSKDGESYIADNLPNFSTSLDAMAEARKTLTPSEQVRYTHEILCQTVWTGEYDESVRPTAEQAIRWGLANATPQQHAEAFLRAKGLWK